ncbi:hypothetical protein Tco_1568347 [Tanacetum coccineum]
MKVLMWLRLAIWENFGYYSNSIAKAKDSFRGNVGVGSVLVIKQSLRRVLFLKGRLVLGNWRVFCLNSGSGPLLSNELLLNGVSLLDYDYMSRILSFQKTCILSKVVSTFTIASKLFSGVTEEDHSLSHPPGFTLEGGVLNEGNTVNLDMKDYEKRIEYNSFVNLEDGKDNSESVNKNSESKRSGHSKYSVLPISLRSLNPKENLGLIDEFYVFERSRPRPKGQKRLVIRLVKSSPGKGKSCAFGILILFGGVALRDRTILSLFEKEEYENARISKDVGNAALISPGPEVCHLAFTCHFWPVIGEDAFKAVDYFFLYGEITEWM